MKATFTLGRIAGIPVGVNWSVLVIFVLIASGLAADYFPSAYPGQPTWTYVLAGVGAAVVFFAGLLAHEISHAVVAKRNGIAVESITLWLLGGVARLAGEAKDPGADMRIAGVGPLVSFLLGVFFGGIALAIGVLAGTSLTFSAFAWLAVINFVLAVFNVLPAAPLDGGRLLRAGLWKWRGDRMWAAIKAAQAGRILGAILVALGIWQALFAGGGFGGLWLVLLGWFLIGAATSEEQQARLGGALTGVRVRDVMTQFPYTAPADVTVEHFLDAYLFRHRFSTFPLVIDGRPVGLVTLNRIKQVEPERRATVRLRDVACPMDGVPVAAPDDDVMSLLGRLNGCSDRRALVLDGEQLVGIVSPADITRALETAGLRIGRAA